MSGMHACPKPCNACGGDNSDVRASNHNPKTNLVGSATESFYCSIHYNGTHDQRFCYWWGWDRTRYWPKMGSALQSAPLAKEVEEPLSSTGVDKIGSKSATLLEDMLVPQCVETSGLLSIWTIIVLVGSLTVLSSLVVKVLCENLTHWAIHGHRLLMESQKYQTLGMLALLQGPLLLWKVQGGCIAYGAPRMSTYKKCAFTMEYWNPDVLLYYKSHSKGIL